MENMPLISVIVPAYCRCEMTKECLDSIAAQTYRNLEIIAVDDGSTDGTPEMLDRYAQKDSRVRVIHQPNGGLSKARNAALDVMRGEYVTFIDNDDYVLPDMVEFLYSIARQYDCDIVSDGSIATEERGITEIE